MKHATRQNHSQPPKTILNQPKSLTTTQNYHNLPKLHTKFPAQGTVNPLNRKS